MSIKWLNLFFKFSGLIFNLKNKIAESDSWVRSLPYALLLILAELTFVVVALPLYFSVSPKKIQERGFVFPLADKNMAGDPWRMYVVRRKIGLAAVLGAGGLFVIKVIFVSAVSFFLLGGQTLLAASRDFTFTNPADYTFDSSKIEITGGVARLKPLVNTVTGSTTNPGFNNNSTGWTYGQWVHNRNGANSGNYVSSGGNPGGYVNISLNVRKNTTEAGYWQQMFSTTVNSPDTATLNLDWKSVTFGAQLPATYRVYAFIDTVSGAPTSTNGAIWNSGEITAVTSWASAPTIDIRSKVPTAGNYYVKFAAYATRPNTSPNNITYVSGFDNVLVSWSKSTTVYDTNRPAITPNISLAPAKPAVWNSFTETAVKNGGEIHYQLSANDGASWDYWNGSSWSSATTTGHYNTAMVVNSNIVYFTTSTNKIRWKAFFESSGSQQVSLSKISVGYTENTLPIVSDIFATEQGTGQVNILYNLSDAESDSCDLVTYEYSLTGAFSGEQVMMTAAVSDPNHNGIDNLVSSPSGMPHIFIWDAAADVGNIYNTTTYVRMRAHDGIGSSGYVISPAFTIDYASPIISNVSVVQAPSSSLVYINYDLFDYTASGLSVEVQASDDNGATWSVPVSSVSGDVGASTTVASDMTIVWDADIDYPNQEKTGMRVRLKATDEFNNQSIDAVSADFTVDTMPPAALITADLLAQPNAGESTVLVFGSFNESNPISNDFYVALNTAGYGVLTAGDAFTAAPSAQIVILPASLTGHDYISQVKISETDGYGHSGDNENLNPNSAYKFVKPYTPPALTIENVIAEGLDLTINKHSSEIDGLEYAVFESTLSKYVQADGGVGDSPVWQTLGTAPDQWGYGTTSVAGKIQIFGLPTPISQYSFHTKSRNISDIGNSPSSESALSSGASADYISPSLAINLVTPSVDGTKYVTIDYTGTDPQNATNNLNVYEFSTDNSNWYAMTEKSDVGSDGVINLQFTPSGAAFNFVWDAAVDLPDTENPAVYVRLQSTDSNTNSNLAASPAFELDIAGPVVANLDVAQVSLTNNIAIQYDLADISGADNFVEMLISDDGGITWAVNTSSVSGDIGSGVNAGVGRNIIWNAGVDYTDQEKMEMKVKIRAKDSLQNQSDYVESSAFALDTKAPVIDIVSAAQLPGSSELGVSYNLSEDCHVTSFEISDDGGATWAVATTSYTGEVGLDQTSGAKAFRWDAGVDYPGQEKDNLMIRMRAEDYFGNRSIYTDSMIFAIDTNVAFFSNVVPTQILGSRMVSISYNLADTSATDTVYLDISSDGGITWNVPTSSLSGDFGPNIIPGTGKTIVWNAGNDFIGQEKINMRVRLRSTDNSGNISAVYESIDFVVDTAYPTGLSGFVLYSVEAATATLNWANGLIDMSFNHYEIWHGSVKDDVINRTGTSSKWSAVNDAGLGNIGAVSTIITGLDLSFTNYFKIWAVDSYGNEATVNVISAIFTSSTPTTTPEESPMAQTGGSASPYIIIPGKPTLSSFSAPVNKKTITISGSADPFTIVEIYDSGSYVGFVKNRTGADGRYTDDFDFTEGEHVLTAKAAMSGGNYGEESDAVVLVVDLTAPDAPAILAPKDNENIPQDTLRITGMTESLSSVEIVIDKTNKFNVSANETGGWYFIVPSSFVIENGRHTISARAVDSAGNIGRETIIGFNKIAAPAPKPAVEVSSVPVKPPIVTPPAVTPTRVTPVAPVVVVKTEPAPTPLPPVEIIRGVNESVEIESLPSPSVMTVSAPTADDIISFSGRAMPNEEVVVYIHSDEALIYKTVADGDGNWRVNHSQEIVELAPGEHTVYAVGMNSTAKIKSPPSPIGTFTIEKSMWVSIYKTLNLTSSIITTAILLLVMGWLYWAKKKEKVAA